MLKEIKKFVKFPKDISHKKIKDFFGKKKLANLISLSNRRPLNINEMITVESYKPELNDLYRLYQFVLLNKRTTILEFGSGFSSLIFSQALKENKNKYKNDVKQLRRNNSFELFMSFIRLVQNSLLGISWNFKLIFSPIGRFSSCFANRDFVLK